MKKTIKKTILIFLIIICVSHAGLFAETNDSGILEKQDLYSESDNETGRKISKQWDSLTDDRKQRILKNYEKYKNLSSEEKQNLKKTYSQFQKLSPEKQSNLKQNYKRWQKMSPQQPGPTIS